MMMMMIRIVDCVNLMQKMEQREDKHNSVGFLFPLDNILNTMLQSYSIT